MDRAMQIVSIIVSVMLIVVILLQAKGEGLRFGGGEPGGVKRTRRGLEKTLHQLTITLSIVFLVVAILAVSSY